MSSRGRIPSLTPRELLRALEKAGWRVHRQKGSHVSLHKPGVRHLVTVPLHRQDLRRGTLFGILDDAGLTGADLLRLLRE
ncbi:MAG: type II toxin-antitoxin system HicA family toxin [Chloroflexi bacterium]|nr:type II toxin-antitoxin system HicA family toxin [Chloroflexota bacterium]